jgi:hypothetical protein
MSVYDEVCLAGCAAGRNMEMLLCGFKKGHDGPHAWASLPTFVNGEPVGYIPAPEIQRAEDYGEPFVPEGYRS